MKRNQRQHKTSPRTPSPPRADRTKTAPPDLLPDQLNRKRTQRFLLIVAALLLAWGIYHAIRYYGHAPFPHADSPYFIRVGHELLSLQVPVSFKRAPVVGLLQALLSYLLPVQAPDLHAGWLLNAILHPLSAVLLWLIGRRFLGRAAAFFAVLALINPWVILRLTESIAETTLMFFTLLTFYLILRRSKWAYLAASLTSMVRYEGTALILAVFVMNLIDDHSRRAWLRQCAYAALALIPLSLWLLATKLTYQTGQSHYLTAYTPDRERHFWSYLKLIWLTSTQPLSPLRFQVQKPTLQALILFSQILTAALFLFAALSSLIKRRWPVLALLIFFLLYLLVHAGRDSLKPRYYAPLAWLVLLICGIGARDLILLLRRASWFPRWARIAAPLAFIALAVIGFIALPALDRLTPYSKASAALPYLAAGLTLALLIAHLIVNKPKPILPWFAVAAATIFMIVANQFQLVSTVGNGQRDIEFKLLVQWYQRHAPPDAKIVATLGTPMGLVAPEMRGLIVHTRHLAHENFAAFTQDCLDRGITYVTWDSRIGRTSPQNSYYRRWHIDNIKPLAQRRSQRVHDGAKPIARYQYLKTLGSRRRYINIFQLTPLTQNQ